MLPAQRSACSLILCAFLFRRPWCYVLASCNTTPAPYPTPAGRFIQKLRAAAASCPSVTVRQGLVKRLVNGEAAAVGGLCAGGLCTGAPLQGG